MNETVSSVSEPRDETKRIKVLNTKGMIVAILLIATWQIISFFSPSYLFPSLVLIGKDLLNIFASWTLASNVLVTVCRILAGIIASFVLGTVIGLIMARYDSVNQTLRPTLNFIQGIPALSWVVIAVIWFRPVELRIFFILLVTTTPNFIFQAFDSYRAIPRDLWEMLKALRPTPMQMFRKLVLPWIVPDLLTAWKINIGECTRVAIVAELVGATVGVGYQLQSAQSLFDMALALAWTLVLVIFVVIAQGIISRVEDLLLSWRPKVK